MMVHHENHHRPFTPPRHGGDGGGGANVAERTLQQPFDYVSATPSPSYSPGMAATLGLGLGYPFTQAQWKELERQAMIYKYMVASLPVPPDLLLPLTTDSRFSLNSGYSLRFGRNGDPEPGRCKRTDGKKWRCSRDAAPDQKYCERHLNRGRPRSRKPVEVSTTTNKKNRNVQPPNPLPAASTNPTSHGTAVNSQAPMFLNCGSSVDFEPSSSLLPHKEPRGMDWLMIGEPHFSEDSLNLNSSASGYSSGKVNHFNECLFSLNSDVIIPMEKPHNTDTTPRGFIDAWSDNSKQTPVSTAHEKLSLSAEDEMGRIHMGLGFTNWNHPSDAAVSKCHPPCWVGSGSWISSAPGGPLAEVLQHRTASPSSGSPLMSSPSGVLQKKVASLSDSSGEGSSPALEPEITLQWFNSTS